MASGWIIKISFSAINQWSFLHVSFLDAYANQILCSYAINVDIESVIFAHPMIQWGLQLHKTQTVKLMQNEKINTFNELRMSEMYSSESDLEWWDGWWTLGWVEKGRHEAQAPSNQVKNYKQT